MNAVCLLSGGLDSATCLAVAQREGFDCYALSFDYGQRHRIELQAAARVAKQLGAWEHRVVQMDLRGIWRQCADRGYCGSQTREGGGSGEHWHSDHLCSGAQHDFLVVCDGVGRKC